MQISFIRNKALFLVSSCRQIVRKRKPESFVMSIILSLFCLAIFFQHLLHIHVQVNLTNYSDLCGQMKGVFHLSFFFYFNFILLKKKEKVSKQIIILATLNSILKTEPQKFRYEFFNLPSHTKTLFKFNL